MSTVIFSRKRLFQYGQPSEPVLTPVDSSDAVAVAADLDEQACISDTSAKGAGPATQQQFFEDINRSLENYYFNGVTILKLMQRLEQEDLALFDSWITKTEINKHASNKSGNYKYQFVNPASALAFTREFLLTTTEEACKDSVITAIGQHIHQAGLNNVAAVAIQRNNYALADKGTEYFMLEEPTTQQYFSATARGIAITSLHTYKNAVRTCIPKTPRGQSMVRVSAENDGCLAKVLCSVSLESSPVTNVIGVKRLKLWVDLQDDRVADIFDTRHIGRKIVDYIKSWFKARVIPACVASEAQPLATLAPAIPVREPAQSLESHQRSLLPCVSTS